VTPAPVYEIWAWTKTGYVRAEEQDFPDQQVASLRAQAIANGNGEQVKVVERIGDVRQDVFTAKPPKRAKANGAATPPPIATPAKLFELYQLMPDGQPAKVGDTSYPSADACQKAARARIAEVRATHILVEVDGDTRKELGRISPAQPEPGNDFDSLLAVVAGKIGGEQKAAYRLITGFFSGFLGVGLKQLPKDKAKLLPALQKLADVIDQRADDLKVDAAALGAELSGRAKSALDQEFDRLNWGPELRAMARQVMQQLGQAEDNFILWMNHPMAGDAEHGTGVSLASMDADALAVFLPLLIKVKGRAWEVPDWCIANNLPLTTVLQRMVQVAEKPVEEWDEKFCGEVLDGMKAQPAQTQQAAPVEDFDDQLAFGN
jgi:hypothetical protein